MSGLIYQFTGPTSAFFYRTAITLVLIAPALWITLRPARALRRYRVERPAATQARRFADQVVIVTGSSSGIGAATANAFAAEGARVVLSAPRGEEDALRALAQRHNERGETSIVVPADVTQGAEVAALAARALEQWGRVDVLVNNAGVGYHGPVEQMSAADFEKVMQINLLGAVRCLYAVVPVMIAQRSGRIVNIASAHSRRAHPRFAAYSASKYALRGLSDTLRVELAQHGISVLTFCPPYTESRFFANVLHTVGTIKPGRAGASPEEVAGRILDATWRRKREVIVTLREQLLALGNKFAPSLIDALIARRYESKLRNQR